MMSRPAERKLRRQERAVEVELGLKKVLFFLILHKNEVKERTWSEKRFVSFSEKDLVL